MLNKDYEKGLCAVEVSGESCANCLTLLPVLTSIISSRDDIKLVHLFAKNRGKSGSIALS